MVGRLSALLENIGHAEGVAHLNKPIAHCRREAVVDAVEAARLPRRDVLLLLLAFFYIIDLVAADAKTNLRPNTQTHYLGFILVIFFPFAEIHVEQQGHVDVVRLFEKADGVATFVQARPRPHALPRVDDINLATKDGTLGDERDTHATREVGAEGGGVVATDLHGGERRPDHQAAAESLCHQGTRAKEPQHEQYKQSFVLHFDLDYREQRYGNFICSRLFGHINLSLIRKIVSKRVECFCCVGARGVVLGGPMCPPIRHPCPL